MANVNIGINGRNFAIQCEDGQEERVQELGHFVDGRVRDIARAGAAGNEAHLLVLTALMLADEVFDLRGDISHMEEHIRNAQVSQQDDEQVAQAINELAERIENVSGRIQGA